MDARERAKKWYYENKERALKRLKITNAIWVSKNKDRKRKINANYSKRWPWIKTYRSIVSRCNSHSFYIKKGIKAQIGVVELKKLWFRDKAFNMKVPSIDRIDPRGNYTFGNCRYVELKEHLKFPKLLQEYKKICVMCSKDFITNYILRKYCSKKCRVKRDRKYIYEKEKAFRKARLL